MILSMRCDLLMKKKFKEKVPGETLRRNVLELISALKWGAGDDVEQQQLIARKKKDAPARCSCPFY